MTIAKIIVGTITGIPRALYLGASDNDDFYAVADALQEARNAVLSEALRRVTVEEGWRLAIADARKPDGGAA